ncbi:16603_t:CDS:10 [Dentiscutata erythropus]|uniref:Phosphoinositide phospholipase C n=1 Tax=Dentiscutata erythropus TaxID=1348616 RepID=A0A9N9AVW9_9GLOM|nr:16603_t:CDS:10 [Dentiscutata erythropus]
MSFVLGPTYVAVALICILIFLVFGYSFAFLTFSYIGIIIIIGFVSDVYYCLIHGDTPDITNIFSVELDSETTVNRLREIIKEKIKETKQDLPWVDDLGGKKLFIPVDKIAKYFPYKLNKEYIHTIVVLPGYRLTLTSCVKRNEIVHMDKIIYREGPLDLEGEIVCTDVGVRIKLVYKSEEFMLDTFAKFIEQDSNTEDYLTIYRQKHTSTSYSVLEITNEIIIDKCLAEGTALLKVSLKKNQQKIFKIDIDQGQIQWDSKRSGKVNIESIEELRVGDAIRVYREHFKLNVDIESRWFTIIYVDFGKYKALHLVAPTLELFNIWVDTLKKLYLHRRNMIGGLNHLKKRHSLWLKQYWKKADRNGDSRLGFDEVANLCHHLNIHTSNTLLRTKFDEADQNKDGWLDFTDFQRFVELIKKRDELDKLFNSLAKERGNILTLQEFKDFLDGVQKCTLKDEYDDLYYKYCDKDLKEMNLEGFSSFLMSSDNSIFALEHAKVYQDMSQPLSHYFIDSSHNTYLLGHQLAGESTIEGYIRVLRKGCRCVEIILVPIIVDCWDGPDGPVVFHGFTLTTKIKFQDVISAIRAYAFEASPYPLILSLEVHCSIEQQNQMASILLNTLGEYLVNKFLSENETELPSPASLLYKIILKGLDSITDAESTTETESNVELSKEKNATKTEMQIAKALSDLVVYCYSVRFKGFNHKNSKYYQVSSFTDRASLQLLKSKKDDFIRHNTRQLTRIYPWGLRVDSSNFEPHHQWMVGNQVVALNSQTFGMQINQAMFSVNGGCGYVLKPERLRNPEISSDINTRSPTQTLTIEIISAQQLPKPNDSHKGEVIDPYIEVELLIPGTDSTKKRTSTIYNNGFNPTWNETLKFTLNYEELGLIFLRFAVWDEDVVKNDDFIASYCIPVTSLQFGYRHVPLNDFNGGKYLFTTLFICSSFEFTPV